MNVVFSNRPPPSTMPACDYCGAVMVGPIQLDNKNVCPGCFAKMKDTKDSCEASNKLGQETSNKNIVFEVSADSEEDFKETLETVATEVAKEETSSKKSKRKTRY